MGIRYLMLIGQLPPDASLIRCGIYLTLLLAWGISIRTRIIQTQVRRYLLSITALMMLWLLLRTVKHSILSTDVQRILWYLYYIPMLFIPISALFISMSLGRDEHYRLPLWTKLFYIPSAVLFMLVLTNDLHQGAFSFPHGIMSDRAYRHEIIYFIILVWIALCALASLIIMFRKCRFTRSKTIIILPLIPLIMSFAYTAVYIQNIHWLMLAAGDMTVTHCLLIFGIFEICIRCGLIQSNIGYDELFEATNIPVLITDEHFHAQYISNAMTDAIGSNFLSDMQTDTANIDDDILLKRHKLRSGWVFWEEDITELNQLRQELIDTRDELESTGSLLEAENAQQLKFLKLTVENRLYEMMEAQTAEQIAYLKDHLDKLQREEELSNAERILGQIIVIGTYIKRRSNLIFVGVQHGMIPSQELRLCLNESAENLIMYGIDCKVIINGDRELDLSQAALVYDLFEAAAEAGLESLKSLLINVDVQEDNITVNVCAACPNSLSELKTRFNGLEWEQDEDMLQYLSLRITL